MYQLGERLYEALSKNRDEDTDIIISPKHIGDTIFLLAFISDYKKKHGCARVMMIVPDSQMELVHLFPSVDRILPVDYVDMEALQSFIFINEYWNRNHIRYAHAKGILELHRSGTVFRENYTHASMLQNTFEYLEIDDTCKPERARLPFFPFSEKHQELYGNAVLLMPGALSIEVNSVPLRFWVALSKKLQDVGLTVYTNYNGKEGELLIEGTIPLSTSFMELIELGRYFRGFIGLRSGICDLIAETDAKLVCYYPESNPETGIEVPPDALDYSCLYDLGREVNMWNYQYLPGQEGALLKETILRITGVKI